jgi:hypothetical protein
MAALNFDSTFEELRSSASSRYSKSMKVLHERMINEIARYYQITDETKAKQFRIVDGGFDIFIHIRTAKDGTLFVHLNYCQGNHMSARCIPKKCPPDDVSHNGKEISSTKHRSIFRQILAVTEYDTDQERQMAILMSDFLAYMISKDDYSAPFETCTDCFDDVFCLTDRHEYSESILYRQEAFNPLAEAYGFQTTRFKDNGYRQFYIHLNLTRRRKDPSFFMKCDLQSGKIDVSYDRNPIGNYEEPGETQLSAEQAITLIRFKLDSLRGDELAIAHMFLRYLSSGKLAPEPMTKAI